MKLKEYDILIDLKKHKQIEDIEVVAGDFGSNILNINIVEGVENYELTGLNVEIAFAKSDGTTVLQDLSNGIELIGNKIKCTLKTNTISSPGKVLAEVRVSEGLKLLTTARFNFNVRKAIVDDETIESTNEYPILNGLISDVNGLIDEIQSKPELRGYSAYDVWLNNGNTGTIDDYLASLIGERGKQGEQGIQGIQGIQGERGIDGDGDMNKAVYDSNGNGVVDMSEDSQKLGGKLAVDYASKTYVDDQVGLITETGIPKYMEYEYKAIGTIGQSKFDIPLETFDSNTDSVDLYINTTYWDRSKYVITNKVGDTLGFITLNAPLEEDKNIVIKVKKNVPMGTEGSTSGSVIADGSIEDRKLTDKTVDDTVVPPIDTNTGLLGSVINWFGNMIKSITGKPTWKEKPTKNLEELNNDLSSHKAETASDDVHGLGNMRALVSGAVDTGILTTPHRKVVISSYQSQVKNNNDSAVIASLRGTVNAAGACIIASGVVQEGFFNENNGRASMIVASRSAKNEEEHVVVGGFTGGASVPSTANRTWAIYSNGGNIKHTGVVSSGHNFTDFAELFPNLTGEKQEYGLLQTIDGHGVRPANEGERIVGVTSATAGIILGDTPFSWQHRWLKDEWGEYIYETIIDDETKEKIQVPKGNPEWDSNLEQISRLDRPEQWTVVGLVGQVYVRLKEDVDVMDYVKAWENGVGKKSEEPTSVQVMKITQEYDAEKGYKIGFCLLK